MESKWLQDVNNFQSQRKQLDIRELPSLDLSPLLSLRCSKCLSSFHSSEQLNTHKCFPTSWVSSRSVRFSTSDKLYQPIHVNMPSTDPTTLYQSYCQRYQRPSPPVDFSSFPVIRKKGGPTTIMNF